MKYKRLLSISIAIGILLPVWVVIGDNTTSSQAASNDPTAPSPSPTKGPIQDAGPFTDFVKHNQGLMTPSSETAKNLKHPKVDPWFFVQLISDDSGKTGYIHYTITDQYGIPTDWHSRKSSSNESPSSTLFSTTFDYTKYVQVSISGGEVQITGTDESDGQAKTWTSLVDNTGNHKDDGDVSWIDPK